MESVSEDPFRIFSPRAYLREYYSHVGPENRMLLDFLHRFYTDIYAVNEKRENDCIEIGGGPTIYQLLSASSKVDRILFLEYLPGNRREVETWKSGAPSAHDWTPFADYVAKLEQSRSDITRTPVEILTETKRKISGIGPVHLLDSHCSIPRLAAEYGFPLPVDIVSTHFCAESITNNIDSFRLAMNKIREITAHSRYFIGSFLIGAKSYRVHQDSFPAYPVTPKGVLDILADWKYKCLDQSYVSAEGSHGYQGLWIVAAGNMKG